MAQITITDLSMGFRGPLLLDDVTCQIELRQRIGLLGRNGSGKTTLLRILAGEAEPDHGELWFAPGTRVALLPQDVPEDIEGPVSQVVAQGFHGEQERTEAWKVEQQVKQVLSRTGLDGGLLFERLSSGMKRRVLLARTLVTSPDVLMLDEPTNHLDIGMITWLEEFLLKWQATLLFVTHDRMFLRRLATRILEIDRGQLFDWSCDYNTFLQRKEAALAAQEKQDALFDKRLAEEEVWIRQSIKARRTRNEGRVRALEDMRRQRRERRADTGRVALRVEEGQRSGNLVAAVKDISFSYGTDPVVPRFSTLVMRGDKIGIIGPNGAGKTTLLRILLGQLEPNTGSVRLGTNLQIAYFDQLRGQLDGEATVQQNVGEGYDTVQVAGTTRHVIGYLQEFLFTPERARMPVKFLSGGERNRVLLARLFAKPANVIVLDEPTNDLDTETLELLEQRLVEFNGTVLLVSHDRTFLNNIVTSTIVFEEGQLRECDGGYDDWQRVQQQEAAQAGADRKLAVQKKGPPKTNGSAESSKARRLSYKEQQELSQLPHQIEKLEEEIAALHEKMTQPDFYQQDGEQIARQHAVLQKLEADLAESYQRWETLEELG